MFIGRTRKTVDSVPTHPVQTYIYNNRNARVRSYYYMHLPYLADEPSYDKHGQNCPNLSNGEV